MIRKVLDDMDLSGIEVGLHGAGNSQGFLAASEGCSDATPASAELRQVCEGTIGNQR